MSTHEPLVDLEAPVWRLDEISAYLRLPSIKSAYSIVQQRTFPRSIVPGKRNRRWLSSEVKEFFATARPVHDPIKSVPTVNSEPQIIHKHRKAKAA
jgi:predicted DNA-binding transcriptional regulator AlpA